MQISAVTFSTDNNVTPQRTTEQFEKPKQKVESKPPTEKERDKNVEADNLEKLKNALAEHNITLKFRQDSDTNALVVEMVDNKTGEAIRQFPSEVSLKLAAIFVKLQGQFVDEIE